MTVAIVDSGLMVGHPSIRDNLWAPHVQGQAVHGRRIVDELEDADVTDEDGHGTMLAGTILAAARAVPAVRLMAVKFFGGATRATARNAARAIDFAVKNGAAIINLSWNVGLGSQELEDAIQLACDAGRLIVIAAGNEGSDNDRFPSVPASYASKCPDRVITVMATDRHDERIWFSNYGATSVDLAAPGAGIVTTRSYLSEFADTSEGESGRYRRYSGTSAASAHVTGAAALVKSLNPNWGAQKLKRCLIESVDEVPDLKCASGGRLNIVKALAWREP